jgi:translation initiation factor 1A
MARRPSRDDKLDQQILEAGDRGFVRVRLPKRERGEIFAIAEQLLGASKIRVVCADGKTRLGRIPGKLRRRMWIREGDLLIVVPWDFQDEKADVVWRYTKTQSTYLSRQGRIPKLVDIF